MDHRSFGNGPNDIRQRAQALREKAGNLIPQVTDVGEALQLMDAQNAAKSIYHTDLESMGEIMLTLIERRLTGHEKNVRKIAMCVIKPSAIDDGLCR